MLLIHHQQIAVFSTPGQCGYIEVTLYPMYGSTILYVGQYCTIDGLNDKCAEDVKRKLSNHQLNYLHVILTTVSAKF